MRAFWVKIYAAARACFSVHSGIRFKPGELSLSRDYSSPGPCSILEYDVTIYHVHKNEFERASPTRCLTLLVLLLAFPLFEYPPVVHQRLEVGVKCIFNHHHYTPMSVLRWREVFRQGLTKT